MSLISDQVDIVIIIYFKTHEMSKSTKAGTTRHETALTVAMTADHTLLYL